MPSRLRSRRKERSFRPPDGCSNETVNIFSPSPRDASRISTWRRACPELPSSLQRRAARPADIRTIPLALQLVRIMHLVKCPCLLCTVMVTLRMKTPKEPLTPSVPPPSAAGNLSENRDDFPAAGTNLNPNRAGGHLDNRELPGRCQFADPIRIGVPSEQRERGISPELSPPLPSVQIDANPLPARCQFSFSDGRQCRMARSEIHPSLCPFHAEREEELFGEPGSHTFGAALDLPELHSACRDLSTPAGVQRALAEVFRLLARRRISRQEAATFAHLGYLLLRSMAAARAEAAFDDGAARGASPKRASELGTPPASSSRREPAVHIERVEPPQGGFLMSADPQPDASSIFRRPNVPIPAEERFVLSASSRGAALAPEERRSPTVSAQPAQNEHLQNLST